MSGEQTAQLKDHFCGTLSVFLTEFENIHSKCTAADNSSKVQINISRMYTSPSDVLVHSFSWHSLYL